MSQELCDFYAYKLRDMLQRKEVSANEILDSVIGRIEKVEGQSGTYYANATPDSAGEDIRQKVHAYIKPLTLDLARQQAQAIDQAIAQGKDPGLLAGIPMAVKDLFCIDGILTRAASNILYNYVAPYTATSVQRMLNQGAMLIGKTNLDEFALGSSTESSAYKPLTRNPWDLSRVPGGSSGGSTAAVAAGEAIIAIGSDTAGSIRQPAALCGVVGLKPTYGRVSRWGLLALASSLDCVGPITRSVKDTAMVLQVIAGHDSYDWTTANEPVPDYLAALDAIEPKQLLRSLVIGWPIDYFDKALHLDESVVEKMWEVRRMLEAEGVKFKDIHLKHTIYAIPVYFVISRVELSSNLHRYDGVKYGYRIPDPVDELSELYARTRTQGFGPQPKQRIFMGMHVSSTDSIALYERARRLRTLIRHDFDEAFKDVDLIMSSTTPEPAFGFTDEQIDNGQTQIDTVRMQNADRLVVPANHAGLPAISIPCGLDKVQNLPIGLQLIAPDFREDFLLQAAFALESLLAFNVRPPIFSK